MATEAPPEPIAAAAHPKPKMHLRELSATCTVREFNKAAGAVYCSTGPGRASVPLVGLFSIEQEGASSAEGPALYLNNRLAGPLGPFASTLPAPGTEPTMVSTCKIRGLMGPCGKCNLKSGGKCGWVQSTRSTNTMHDRVVELGIAAHTRPFLTPGCYDAIEIRGAAEDTKLTLTGFNFEAEYDWGGKMWAFN